jgi:hypothetical protein
MKQTRFAGRRFGFLAFGALVLTLSAAGGLDAQRGRGGAGPPPTARSSAPIDPTGYWVSLITEDWRYRMGVGIRGDFERSAVPLNAAGQDVARRWDPEGDASAGLACKPYGAGGIMRMPGRLHITWADDNTLQVEADAGMQTRTFRFGNVPAAAGERTWQGHSVARWMLDGAGRGGGGGQNFPAEGATPPARPGELEVVTGHLRPGYYYWLDGMPYGEQAVVTEHFRQITEPSGDTYLLVTIFVEDPEFLADTFVETVHFKKEPDGSRWSPRPCTAS